MEVLTLEQRERIALAKVAEYLRAGKFVHFSDPKVKNQDYVFDMGITCSISGGGYGCGTVACIGGWTWIVMNCLMPDGTLKTPNQKLADAYVYDSKKTPLKELYFPELEYWSIITATRAAAAIDNFLACGDPKWEEVIKS